MSPNHPVLKPKEVIKALQKAGYIIERVRGSHYIMKHPTSEHPTSDHRFLVPYHNTDIKKDCSTASSSKLASPAKHFWNC